MPAEHKVSAFSALGGEGSLAGGGTPRKEVAIGAGHGGRGWSRIVSQYPVCTLIGSRQHWTRWTVQDVCELTKLCVNVLCRAASDVMKEGRDGDSKPSRMLIFDAPPNSTAEEKTATRMAQQAPGGRRYKDQQCVLAPQETSSSSS
jgi:hypothetical protein